MFRLLKLAAACAALSIISTPIFAAEIQLKVASTSKQIIDNLPLYVADRAGLFAKQGLKVEVSHFRGGGEVVRAVAGGGADVGMVATSAGIIAIGRGEPLRIVSAWTAPAYGIVWIVPKDSPIKSVAELAGKQVGISRPGSVSHTGLLAALKAAKIENNVSIVPVGGPGDSWSAVKTGRVSASWHTAPDVYSLVDNGHARILFQISDYLSAYQQGALIAETKTIKDKADTLKKFLTAIKEANALIASLPDKAAEFGATSMDVPAKLVLETLQAAPKGFFTVGAPTKDNLAGSIDEAKATGALKTIPSYGVLVNTSVLP